MGKYSVPADIRALKPRGTMVKKITGGYYVYEYRMERGEDGKRHTRMGRCIGKITLAEGFLPNDVLLRGEEVTSLDFGEWAIALANSQGTHGLLRRFFSPREADQIYVAALIHFVQGFTYVKDLSKYVGMSVLCLRFPSVHLGRDATSELYEDLGRRQGPALRMQQALASAAVGPVALDGHVIGCCSGESGIAAKGCKFKKIAEEQVNLLMAYDASSGLPLLSRLYEGGAVDKVTVQDLLQMVRFVGVIFVVDRGFYSEENLELLTRDGNNYVIPLAKSLKACKAAVSDLTMTGRFVWQKGSKIAVVAYKEQEVGGRRVIVFRDENEAAVMQANYLRHMKRGDKGYTQEKFDELSPLMAVQVLQTSIAKAACSAERVYGLYKNRWPIETYFDYFANGQDCHTLCQQDYHKMQGLAFLMLVSGLIHREVADAVAESGLGMSVADVLLDARAVKASKRVGMWVPVNCKKKRLEAFEALHTPLEVVPKAKPNEARAS